MAGKATAFVGPILVGVVTAVTSSPRAGISPVVALFMVGILLLFMANRRSKGAV